MKCRVGERQPPAAHHPIVVLLQFRTWDFHDPRWNLGNEDVPTLRTARDRTDTLLIPLCIACVLHLGPPPAHATRTLDLLATSPCRRASELSASR